MGTQYAELRDGNCPWHLQHLSGKSLPISFVGTYPFITYNPIGGRDLKVIAALAKKLRFLPNLIPMATFDGMAQHVSNKYLINFSKILIQKSEQVASKLSELGIGQLGMVFNERRFIVDNLPWMSVYEWPIENIKPKEVASFATLMDPFDDFSWAFVFGAVVVEFVILIIMQLVWSHVAEKSTPKDFVYQGEKLIRYRLEYLCRYKMYMFADWLLSTFILIGQSLSQDWLFREGFKTRRIILLKWLVLANFLTLGYMSTLLSQLVAIKYENPIDTIDDLDKSGLPLLIPGGTGIENMIANDPKPAVKRIYSRSLIHPLNGSYYPSWVDDM